MARHDILIVGAGPTGLMLALWLARLGVRPRIIDKAAAPGTTSRAIGVQARTLELYRQIGLDDEVIGRGLVFGAANLWVRARLVARVPFGDLGKGLSRYPYMLMFPQDEHERVLIERLQGLGIAVERPTELASFQDRGDHVVAHLKRADGSAESCEATYLAGCDGSRSVVREGIGASFPGGTYDHLFYVADVVGSGPVMNHELHVALDDAGFFAAFPMAGEGRARLIGTIKDDALAQRRPFEWSDVSASVFEKLSIRIERVNWFSTYRVHHRVAERFRSGRAFLMGDAAHIHSPVGAQGMNTGLLDAINFAWKLAAVLQGRAAEKLLDTYEPERIAFARRLIATTDRAFQVVTSDTGFARFVRTRVVPFALPKLFSVAAMRRFMFRTISQTVIEYRSSALSSGRAGAVRAGDRLPWLPFDDTPSGNDNYASLARLDWQLHVYGEPSDALRAWCETRGLALSVFAWRDTMGRAGFARNAAYLIRPDGYVGFADASADVSALERYVTDWALRARESDRSAR